MTLRVSIVGTGDPNQPERYAMGYRHAQGYRRADDCELIACADLVEANALAFADVFNIPGSNVYSDYETMLAETSPDVVSVCTPPRTHADIVVNCARSDEVDAVHCEKPMAGTWGDCRRMVDACDRRDVQLTFNHQRRFAAPFRKAKGLVQAGRIGDLRRVEIGGSDLYDVGTHLFDICGYITDQTPVEWVLGQVDCRDPDQMYGLYQEGQALARWQYASGVDGFASTGEDGLLRCHLRLVGEDGIIEVGHGDGPTLRVRVDGSGWKGVDTGRDGLWRPRPHPLDRVVERVPFGPDRLLSEPTYVGRGIRDVVDGLRSRNPPELSARNALQTTEVIFACWESARRGGCIALPLEIDENPLEAMVENRGSRCDSTGDCSDSHPEL